ncbi:MAG: hypothetical protein QME05_04390 [Candidatus Margulisbacteria bacterium]|nr:hypothetical protein [Candidatus Margulisiibacteriota bacterium]
MAELEMEQAAGAGATPNYLVADRGQFKIKEITDSAAISGAAFTSTGINSALSSAEKSHVNFDAEDGQYLENSSDYQNAVDGTTSSTSNSNNAIDQINSLDQELTDMVLGFDEEDYITDAKGGYSSVDAEALEAWAQQLMARLNAFMCLLIALSSLFETKWIVDETFSGIPMEQEGKNSYKESFSRKAQFLLKIVNVAILNVFNKVNKENMEHYNDKVKELKTEGESSGAKTAAVISGGNSADDLSAEMLQETENYLNATNATLEALQKVIAMIIASLAADAAASDEFSTFFLGMISSLERFNQEIEELQEKIDANLQEALDAYEEYKEKHEFWDNLNGGLVGVLVGMAFPVQWLIWAIDKWTNTDFADNLINPAEELDVEGLISQYRGQLVGMENAFRMYLSLQLLKHDLRNAVRSQFTGLTGVSNDAELLMVSAEGRMGDAVAMFDMTTTQLMIKTQLHQSTVDILRGLQDLQKAKPWLTLAVSAIVAAIVIAIVIIIVSWGTLTAPAILGLIAVESALCGAASAAASAAAESLMNNIEEYSPVEADYGSEDDEDDKGVGQTVIDELERMEDAEEANMKAAAKNKDLMIESGDGYYTFDTEAFAAYQMRQTAYDNAIRCIFDIMKNARDLRRIAQATFTGYAFQDSGESLLQNAVENVLSQKQMVLSAIKFQQQQVISAKNIARQKELAEKENTKNAVINIGGSVVSILLNFIPYVGPILSLLMTLAISIYNFVNAGWGEGCGRNMDIESSYEKELRELFDKKGGDSVEAKLDQAEAQAYLDAISDATIVDTGNGYVDVDFDAITSIYDRLGRIYAAKEAIAKARALKSELLAIVREQMSGISTPVTGSLTQSVNQANFRTAMQVMGDMVSFQSARANILNRAHDAEKKFIMSAISMGINAVAFVVACVVYIVNLAAQGLQMADRLQKAASTVKIISGAANLANSATQFASNWHDAAQGYGEYEGYQAKTTVDRTSKKTTNARTIDEKLDQMEYETLCAMNEQLIVTLDGTYQGVSAGSAKLSSKMQALYNIKECIAIARSIASAARRAAGAKIYTGDYGQDSVEEKEAVAMAMLDSLKSALEALVSRENQISSAKKGMLLSGISVALSAASLACSIAAAKADSNRVLYTSKDSKGSAAAAPTGQAGSTPVAPQSPMETTPSPATSSTPTPTPSPTTSPSPPTETVGSGDTSDLGDNQDYKDSIEQSRRDRKTRYSKESFWWSTAGSLCSFASSVLNVVVSASYDEAANNKAEKAGTKEEDAATKETGKTSAQGKSTDSNSNSTIFSSFDSHDAEMAELDYSLANIQNMDTASAYIAARNQQWVDSIMPWIRDAVSQTHGIVSGNDKVLSAAMSDKAKAAVPVLEEIELNLANKSPELCAKELEPLLADAGKKEEVLSILQYLAEKSPKKAAKTIAILVQSQKLPEEVLTQLFNNLCDTGKEEQADELLSALAASGKVPSEMLTQLQTAFQAQEKASPSTRALLDYADQIEEVGKRQVILAEEVPKAQAEIAEMESKRAELTQQIEQPAQPINAEARAAIEAEIAMLEEQISEKRKLLDELINSNQAVLDEVKRLEAEKPKLLEASRQEVIALKSRLDAVCLEITALEARLPSLKPEEKAQLEQLTRERDTLKGQIGLAEETQKAVAEDQQMQIVRQKAQDIKTQIDATKAELQTAQKQIAGLRRVLAKREKTEEENSQVVQKGKEKVSSVIVDSAVAAIEAQDGQGGSGAGGQGQRKDKKTVFQWLFGAEAGDSASSNAVASRQIPLPQVRSQSIQDKYHSAVNEDDLIKDLMSRGASV